MLEKIRFCHAVIDSNPPWNPLTNWLCLKLFARKSELLEPIGQYRTLVGRIFLTAT